MSQGVIYLLTGVKHAARLVVSIHSLRSWYDGPISLFTTRPESHQIGSLCCNDPSLGVDHFRMSEAVEHPNSSYVAKVLMLGELPYEVNLFLDADTLVCGEVGELFHAAHQTQLVVTAVACWKTTDSHRRKLLEKWLDLKATIKGFDVEALVGYCLENSLPAINTGVYVVHRNATVIEPWMKLAQAGYTMPIPDETSLQLLLPQFEHALFGTEYNGRPGAVESSKIWHFLAGIHLKEKPARELWLPAYDVCWSRNTASIRTWSKISRSEEPPQCQGADRPNETSPTN